ncbi:host attachment family protein [Mesorhizobium carmichaelinearum]|uniref:host attachment family protein n=1 Tax=Mesorhizobium carmichaelinearum TaxID=1208188 RepID=UPI001FCE6C3C|nr:host attachment protein [Mesorhizobium carmichaelinearum]
MADGKRLNLFRNSGDESNPKLTASVVEDVANENKGSGARHQSSSAQIEEDSFAAGTADLLNRQVLGGQIANLIIIAAPRTLGELRKHYHQKLSDVLIGEIAKDLTGHSAQEIEKAVVSA